MWMGGGILCCLTQPLGADLQLVGPTTFLSCLVLFFCLSTEHLPSVQEQQDLDGLCEEQQSVLA